MSRPIRTHMAALGLLALLAGCGSSNPASSAAVTTTSQPAVTAAPTATADSCSVITQAEAGAALGQAVRAPVRGRATVEGGIACVYYAPGIPRGADPDIAIPGSVRVVLVTGSQALRYFNDYKSKIHAQPITGYGDQAYYDGGASLSVLKGDAYLRVAVGKVANLSAEEMLAADALPRL